MDIIKGQRYTGTLTFTNRGIRGTRTIAFVAARSMTPEAMVRSGNVPNQDRVFVVSSHGSCPQLFVTGSIFPA